MVIMEVAKLHEYIYWPNMQAGEFQIQLNDTFSIMS